MRLLTFCFSISIGWLLALVAFFYLLPLVLRSQRPNLFFRFQNERTSSTYLYKIPLTIY
jgi:hypothetical protein